MDMKGYTTTVCCADVGKLHIDNKPLTESSADVMQSLSEQLFCILASIPDTRTRPDATFDVTVKSPDNTNYSLLTRHLQVTANNRQ